MIWNFGGGETRQEARMLRRPGGSQAAATQQEGSVHATAPSALNPYITHAVPRVAEESMGPARPGPTTCSFI